MCSISSVQLTLPLYTPCCPCLDLERYDLLACSQYLLTPPLFTIVSVHILKRMVCGRLAQPQGPMCLSLITLVILTTHSTASHRESTGCTFAHHFIPTAELNLLLWSPAQGVALMCGQMPSPSPPMPLHSTATSRLSSLYLSCSPLLFISCH